MKRKLEANKRQEDTYGRVLLSFSALSNIGRFALALIDFLQRHLHIH